MTIPEDGLHNTGESLHERSHRSLISKVLSVILILAILAAIGAVVYVFTTFQGGEEFTEFYILGQEGKAEDYPAEVAPGEEASVIIGIVNRERKEISYRIEISMYGVVNTSIGPVVLADKEKWEQEVSFIPTVAGERQRVDFSLYKDQQVEPYRELRLWINVNGS